MAKKVDMERSILIHPGYMKCASSWLQRKVFVPELGFGTPWPNLDNEAIEAFAWTNPERFDAINVRGHYLNDWNATGNADQIAVLSHEALVGNPILGIYWGFEVADRLAQTFPEAKVLICVREQKAFIYSAWSEYIRRGGLLPIDRFGPLIKARPGYRPLCPEFFLAYNELVAHYIKLFGAEQVLCLPVELLAKEPEKFLSHLSGFVGSPAVMNAPTSRIYPGLGGGSLWGRRILNHFAPMNSLGRAETRNRGLVRKVTGFCNRHLPTRIQTKYRDKFQSMVEREVGDAFRSSNQELQSYVPVNLKNLGYPI